MTAQTPQPGDAIQIPVRSYVVDGRGIGTAIIDTGSWSSVEVTFDENAAVGGFLPGVIEGPSRSGSDKWDVEVRAGSYRGRTALKAGAFAIDARASVPVQSREAA